MAAVRVAFCWFGARKKESQRVAAWFEEDMQLAEQAFVIARTDLVAHLTERLTSQAGKKTARRTDRETRG